MADGVRLRINTTRDNFENVRLRRYRTDPAKRFWG